MPNKGSWIGVIGSDKGIILDVIKKKIIRSIPKWSGNISKDGKYTLYAPSRFVFLLAISLHIIHFFVRVYVHHKIIGVDLN